MDGRSNLVVRSRHWIEFVRTGFDLDLIQMDNIIGEESFFFFFENIGEESYGLHICNCLSYQWLKIGNLITLMIVKFNHKIALA